MLNELRHAHRRFTEAREDEIVKVDTIPAMPDMREDTANELAKVTGALLDEPTNVQALALARLMRDRPHSGGCSINTEPFDLPNGYWLVVFTLSGFTCGIAPNGDVSS